MALDKQVDQAIRPWGRKDSSDQQRDRRQQTPSCRLPARLNRPREQDCRHEQPSNCGGENQPVRKNACEPRVDIYQQLVRRPD